jgi:hypothetical protein
VEVLTRLERRDQVGVGGQVRHDPHLDLAVVGRQQALVALPHHERLADAAPRLGADRDVLQVGVGRREPAGGRDQLVEGGVDAPVGADRLAQPLDGGAQPAGVPVGQQVHEEGVLGLVVQTLQRLGISGPAGLGALGLRHLQLLEQHHLQLLGRAQVDLLADLLVRGVGRVAHQHREVVLEPLEVRVVDRDPRPFHVGEHRDQRELDLTQQPGAAERLEVGGQRLGQVDGGPGAEHGRLGGGVGAALVEV